MTKEAVDAAIAAVEGSVTTTDTWVLLFAALVAIGVVGEAVLGIRHWILDGRLHALRTTQSQLHEKELTALRNDTTRLTTEGDQARAAFRGAEARALEAQVALERFKAPRILSAEQLRDVADKMSGWKTIPSSEEGQSAAVFALGSDLESLRLADQIAEALGPQGSGFKINRYPVTYGTALAVSGVGILTSTNSRGIKVAEDLAAALTLNGVDAFVIPQKRVGGDEAYPAAASSISVMVGEKPPK